MKKRMSKLTIIEQILLLVIWKLKEEAYGVKIRELFCEYSQTDVGFGTLYNNLEQLVRKGYTSTFKGESTPIRGGKRKIYYKISDLGINALQISRELQNKLWENVPELAFIKK